MAYATIDDPAKHFDPVLTTGTGNTQEISTLNFQPDFIWGKRRDASGHQTLFDSVRGVTKGLEANQTGAEFTSTDYYDSFDNDGFTIAAGASGAGNGSSQTAVNYCWKAGTAFSNDASSTSVGTIDSSGSINTTAGFSIQIYTGSNANSNIGSIAHGLGAAPDTIWVKDRDATSDWLIFHTKMGNNKILEFNDYTAAGTDANAWNNTAPSSTVFTVGDNSYTNANGRKFVAWLFTSIKGYSRFGTYQGNGNSNGPYVHCGFRPAYVIIKSSSHAVNWKAFDNKRDPHNKASGTTFNLNENGAEDDNSAYKVHLNTNGFKLRNTNSNLNSDGYTYTYYAWAESPFVNSNGIPTNAR